jgi:hypothetical protein
MNEQQQALFDEQKARILLLEPRGFKSDGSGVVKSFTIDHFQLNGNNQLISVQGTAVIRNSDDSETGPFEVLWNQSGATFHHQEGARVVLDLVRKVPNQ